MDENKATNGTQETENAPETKATQNASTNAKTEPSEMTDKEKLEDLMVEFAKVKRAQEKAASEAADYKKKYRESLSEKEQADLAKAEKEAQREEEYQSLVRENRINKLEKSYLAFGYTADEASRIAVAEVDNDFESRMKIMQEVDARKTKALKADWQKSIPYANVGNGESGADDPFLKGFNSVKTKYKH